MHRAVEANRLRRVFLERLMSAEKFQRRTSPREVKIDLVEASVRSCQIYCPHLAENLHIMLLSVREFRENRRRESRVFFFSDGCKCGVTVVSVL